MKKDLLIFSIRWFFNALGLWLAIRFLVSSRVVIPVDAGVLWFSLAGLAFSLINSLLKPFIVVLALPFIALSLGFFMLVVNGLMVYLSLKIFPHLSITFFGAIIIGLVLSLVNYIVDMLLIDKLNRK